MQRQVSPAVLSKGVRAAYRGSRKHVLDWVERPEFLVELLQTVAPVDCRISASSRWQPISYDNPDEARLERFGPRALPGYDVWPALTRWWLKYASGANTPNWDIALACEVMGEPGLVLVEAKANVPELSRAGKRKDSRHSPQSDENHEHIDRAIMMAREALAAALPGIRIDRDSHYQLSNRLAFAWKLASLGIPTVLLYLGFLSDEGIRNVGEPFRDDAHWQSAFRNYLSGICPLSVLDGPVRVSSSKFWLLSRSRPIIEMSPPAS